MAWYVFALLDRAPRASMGTGLSAPVRMRDLGGCVAAVERRSDVPPIELGTLQAHHRAVARLWRHTPAVLPVRFGTLLESDELVEAVEGRDEELREAFDLVRKRAQFTWRGSAARRPAARKVPRARAASISVSGAEYLRRAARGAAPPPRFSTIRRAVRPFVTAERYQSGRPTVPEALYHLVDTAHVTAYRAAAVRIPSDTSAPTLSGPFPPYAFVPEILR